jgi:hypothetical protein
MSFRHPARRRSFAPLGTALATALFTAAAFAGKPFDLADLPRLAASDGPGGAEPAVAADAALLPPQIAPRPAAPGAAPGGASVSVTVNLIKQLVEIGVLPKDKAETLLKQAEAESVETRAQWAAERDAAVQVAVAQALAGVQANPAAGEPLPPAEDSSRITYIPEVVRAQLRDEIKRDLATTAKTEHWAGGPKLPDWAERFRFFADVRLRGEGVSFQDGNDNTGAFPNFNAINTGSPFDTSGTVFSPQLNVDQNRQRVRLRARFGVESDLGDGFTAGIRLATGNTNGPTTTNQDLGGAQNGQGGNFSKYAIWLDRAFVKWEGGPSPDRSLALLLGRFDNPFFATEVIYDEDLGFDGLAVKGRYRLGKKVTPFFTAGAFPVFNTDLNFASNQPAKFASDDKWLYGAQLGADFKLADKVNFKLAAAYYHFDGVEGQLSDPFVPLTASDAGNTDGTRPSFAQKGNTYRPLRNIIPTAENDFGTSKQFQYYGLATPFRNLVISGKLEINRWEPAQITVFGEYIKNLAFDRNAIDAIAVNNRGSNGGLGGVGRFEGGDTAWIIGARVGKPAFEKFGDWAASLSYRYVESDAVVDGFADSEFGLGGTNLQGFSLWAGMALSERVSVGVRWMSSDEIAGPQLSVDTIQFDFNAKF